MSRQLTRRSGFGEESPHEIQQEGTEKSEGSPLLWGLTHCAMSERREVEKIEEKKRVRTLE